MRVTLKYPHLKLKVTSLPAPVVRNFVRELAAFRFVLDRLGKWERPYKIDFLKASHIFYMDQEKKIYQSRCLFDDPMLDLDPKTSEWLFRVHPKGIICAVTDPKELTPKDKSMIHLHQFVPFYMVFGDCPTTKDLLDDTMVRIKRATDRIIEECLRRSSQNQRVYYETLGVTWNPDK